LLSNNWIALLITFLVALLWLRLNDYAAHRGWIDSQLSRKIIHIGTGPIFVACWVLFNAAPISRFLASLVPLSFTLQFLLVGLGVMRDESAVSAMTRTGDRREILRGPLYYGIMFVLLTILYWLESPIGMVALMILCGGDGLADILGRRYGSGKLPWNKGKSWVGSAGMLLGGWTLAVGMVGYNVALGVFQEPFTTYIPAITIIALAATLVETLPLKDLDNITITLSAVVLGHLLF
jgi:phytol kinase